MLPPKTNKLYYVNVSHNSISSVSDLVLKVLGNCQKHFEKQSLCSDCKLDLSYNNFSFQETHFMHKIYIFSQLYDILDLYNNNINKCKVILIDCEEGMDSYYTASYT